MLVRRDVRWLLAGALIAVMWLAARELAGHESGLLYMLPMLTLLLPLLLQRYPGEGRILALAAKLRRPRRPRSQPSPVAVRSLVRARLGVGETLAFELAGRAPPLES